MLEAVVTKEIANTANTLLLEARCNSSNNSSKTVASQKFGTTRSEEIPTVIAIATIRAFRASILVSIAYNVAALLRTSWKSASVNFRGVSLSDAGLDDYSLLNAVSASMISEINALISSTAAIAIAAKKRLKGIFYLVLRCPIDYGVNVNVEKYAYRCCTSRGNPCSCYRRK